MNKKIIGMLMGFAVVVTFTGCEQVQKQVTNTKQQVQNEITQSQYAVDESDNIKPQVLFNDTVVSELTDAEKAGLIQMREEEKLAHDVYVTFYEKWGQNIFNNISKSEQTHTNTIKYLLDKYEIDDPTTNTTVGVFTSSDMQKLYDDLVMQGNKSLGNALVAGAMIEDLDISDLNKLLANTTNEDVKIVYQNLSKGSRNHMRAFVRNIEKNGETYMPQYISTQEFQAIIEGQQEQSSVNGQVQNTIEKNQTRRGQGNERQGMNRVR